MDKGRLPPASLANEFRLASSRPPREPENGQQWDAKLISSHTGWEGPCRCPPQRRGLRQDGCQVSPGLVTVAGSRGCVSVRTDACWPSDSSRSHCVPCPIIHPGAKASASSLISLHQLKTLSGPCLRSTNLVSSDQLAPCHRLQFHFPIPTPPSSCQIAEQPLRFNTVDTWLSLRHQGGSTGCAACRPFSSGPVFLFLRTAVGALLPSFDLGIVIGCMSWSVERPSA